MLVFAGVVLRTVGAAAGVLQGGSAGVVVELVNGEVCK